MTGARKKGWFAAASLALVFIVGVPAMESRADEAADRAKLIDAAKDHLKEMADHVEDVGAAKGIKDATAAAREAVALKKTIANLEKVQGDDATAKDITKYWPGHTQHFLETMGTLARMKKDGKRIVNIEDKNVAEWCADTQEKLPEKVKKIEQISELLEKAEKTAKQAKSRLKQAKRIVVETKAAESQVDHFKAPGLWQKVTDAVDEASTEIRIYVEEQMKQAEKDCADLVKGRRNPVVVERRDIMTKDAGKVIAHFQKKVDAWEKSAAGFFDLDCKSMQTINEVFCGIDTEDDLKGNNAVWNFTKKVAVQIRHRLDQLENELEDLKEWAEKLEKREDTSENAKKIINETLDETSKFAAIMAKGALKGRNHPAIKFYINYGIKMHKKMESSNKCDVRDRSFGGVGRPDCVKAKGCLILEFKPKSPSAEAKGRTQLNKYLPSVNGYYTTRIDKPKTIDRDLGGKEMMANLKRNGCVKNGKVRFKTKVETYDRCPAKYQCIR